MTILDFLGCFAGACLALILHCCIEAYSKKQEEKWPYVSVFIHPRTRTSYTVRKNKNNECRCYINGIRVPNKWVINNGNT